MTYWMYMTPYHAFSPFTIVHHFHLSPDFTSQEFEKRLDDYSVVILNGSTKTEEMLT